MPSERKLFEPDKVYHVWSHANGNDNLFVSDANYRYFLNKYKEYILPVVDTLAYCLMPNHLHLMIRVKGENEVLQFLKQKKKTTTLQGFQTLEGFSKTISKQFSDLFNGYTQAYNKQFNRKGSLFNPRFPRKLIKDESHFTTLIAYIHHNPVHHGFVKNIDDWPYSSWHAYLSDQPTQILRNEGLDWFGGRNEFVEFHRAFAYDKWEEILER